MHASAAVAATTSTTAAGVTYPTTTITSWCRFAVPLPLLLRGCCCLLECRRQHCCPQSARLLTTYIPPTTSSSSSSTAPSSVLTRSSAAGSALRTEGPAGVTSRQPGLSCRHFSSWRLPRRVPQEAGGPLWCLRLRLPDAVNVGGRCSVCNGGLQTRYDAPQHEVALCIHASIEQ